MSDTDDLRAAYDEAPYQSMAHPQSAPGQLAALAWIFGLDASTSSTARVLEIGCASGGNLIPFAATYPDARVVGIDLSPTQVEQGRALVDELGLTNLEFINADITDVELGALGEFDYVICHGVYSWVPPEVADGILAACERVLAPTGVAYVSYNTYPGWKAKEIVRDAMLLAIGEVDGAERRAGAEAKVRSARDMVDFLQQVAEPNGVLARALADYLAMAGRTGDYYLLHEELEPFNNPCYFREFASRAADHGLAYLGDAQPEFMFVQN